MPIHKTCAFSNAPIEENKEVVVVYLATEIRSLGDKVLGTPFTSSDYTYAWDNFKIIGFPLFGKFIGHSNIEYESEKDHNAVLGIINRGSVEQYTSLHNLNKSIISNKFKATKRSANKQVTSFVILKKVFDLLKKEKRYRHQNEWIFKIPDNHDNFYLTYEESLLENKEIFNNLKEKNIELLNDYEPEHDECLNNKERMATIRRECRSKVYTGKNLFQIALENDIVDKKLGEHLTNLYWVAFCFDEFRKPLMPTLHSHEDRDYFKLAKFYRKLADTIETESIADDDVLFQRIKNVNDKYLIKEKDLRILFEDYESDYIGEVFDVFEKYNVSHNKKPKYVLETKSMLDAELNLIFEGDWLNPNLKGSTIIIE